MRFWKWLKSAVSAPSGTRLAEIINHRISNMAQSQQSTQATKRPSIKWRKSRRGAQATKRPSIKLRKSPQNERPARQTFTCMAEYHAK